MVFVFATIAFVVLATRPEKPVQMEAITQPDYYVAPQVLNHRFVWENDFDHYRLVVISSRSTTRLSISHTFCTAFVCGVNLAIPTGDFEAFLYADGVLVSGHYEFWFPFEGCELTNTHLIYLKMSR